MSETTSEREQESCSSFSPPKEIPQHLRPNTTNSKSKLLEFVKKYEKDQIYVFNYTHMTFEEKCSSWKQSTGCCELCNQACEDYFYSILSLLHCESDNQFQIYVCIECSKNFYDREYEDDDIQLIWAEFKNGQIATSIGFQEMYPLVRN